MKFKNLTIGKLLGIIVLIDLQIFLNIAFFIVPKSDIIQIIYINLIVLSIVWGAKSYKNFIDKKIKKV